MARRLDRLGCDFEKGKACLVGNLILLTAWGFSPDPIAFCVSQGSPEEWNQQEIGLSDSVYLIGLHN